jgi:hypothetical protein
MAAGRSSAGRTGEQGLIGLRQAWRHIGHTLGWALRSRTAPWLALKEANMDNTTLLIIIILVVILLGGGWYGRGRWF